MGPTVCDNGSVQITHEWVIKVAPRYDAYFGSIPTSCPGSQVPIYLCKPTHVGDCHGPNMEPVDKPI